MRIASTLAMLAVLQPAMAQDSGARNSGAPSSGAQNSVGGHGAAADGAAPAEANRETWEKLIEQVRKAHWRRTEDQPLTQFHAYLRTKPTREGANSVDLELEAWFARPLRENGRPVFLRDAKLRYRTSGDAEAIAERGYDGAYWVLGSRGLRELEGRNDEQEIDQTRQHVRLASQLLQFTDPRAVLNRLEDVLQPELTQLPIARGKSVTSIHVTGRLPSFPLYAPPANPDGQRIGSPPVQFEAWFHPENRQILAVAARPVDDDGKVSDLGEFYMLADPTEVHGVLVPKVIRVYRTLGRRKLPEVEITIQQIEFDDLKPDQFARPRR